MPLDIVKGSQWGDEGKANISYFLMTHYGYQVHIRLQGGDNAGGTAWVIDRRTGKLVKIVLHLTPAGIFLEGTTCILAPGVVVNPKSLQEELIAIQALGYSTDNLLISSSCPIILPSNLALDGLDTKGENGTEIGTTKKGIGPTYEYFYGRKYSISVGDVVRCTHDELRTKLEEGLRVKNLILREFDRPEVTIDKEYEFLMTYRPTLAKHVHWDIVGLNHQYLEDDVPMLGYIAHGSELDICNGTRPYVTSSFCTTGAACVYAGIPPQVIRNVYCIIKAYTTRVDSGQSPFPTEIHGDLAENLRQRGGEYGATTGRPRRVGWLDLAQARHALRMDGVTHLVMTKLDVLNGFDAIKVCTHYTLPDSNTLDHFAPDLAGKLTPHYEEFPGWASTDDENAKNYVHFIEESLGHRISIMSLGPSIDDVAFT
ncbi:adenylosuccinate synthase [Candidatus Falkowbacteria bacterium CG10_big_fil_rev_8_21_14_0_10_39_11]|uniref:Adenylosuccinate synthetase n=1 Tax=Candidatus Falkowbacteria bacterium CG10_big_fil_rev_8_21_14_0_10_39_11 TaxID=1974565 RepID=A0A2H0V3N4_9BACT|nr:MAG: adenylosuccinate synthase [Candidatus Falkowbacteria bacterium CG10_big_fil_rev_8_21_14_0_10_39_11]